jgi:hypothetical protein
MKMYTFGIALIILGVMMFVYTGFNFVTSKNVVDIGSITINRDENHLVQWSPVAGIILFATGVVLIIRGRK